MTATTRQFISALLSLLLVELLESLDDEKIEEELQSTRMAKKILHVCTKCGAAPGKGRGCTECCVMKNPKTEAKLCEAPGDCKADGCFLCPRLGCQRFLCSWRAQDGAVCLIYAAENHLSQLSAAAKVA